MYTWNLNDLNFIHFPEDTGKRDLLFFQDRGEQLFDKYLNTRSQTNTPTELQELDLEKKL